jgi:hypothetical protein
MRGLIRCAAESLPIGICVGTVQQGAIDSHQPEAFVESKGMLLRVDCQQLDDRRAEVFDDAGGQSLTSHGDRCRRRHEQPRGGEKPKDLAILFARKESHADNEPDKLLVVDSFAVASFEMLADTTVDGFLRENAFEAPKPGRILGDGWNSLKYVAFPLRDWA